MRRSVRLAVGAVAMLGLSVFAAPLVVGADTVPGPSFFGGGGNVVFVQTDNTAGNQVVAYDSAGRHVDARRHLRHRWPGRRSRAPSSTTWPRRDRSPMTSAARLCRGQRRQQHGVGLLGARRPPHAASGCEFGRRRSLSASPSTATTSTVLNAENGGSVRDSSRLRLCCRRSRARIGPWA